MMPDGMANQYLYKELSLKLSLQDFLQKFKRLDFRLSPHGSIDSQEITITKVEDWQ